MDRPKACICPAMVNGLACVKAQIDDHVRTTRSTLEVLVTMLPPARRRGAVFNPSRAVASRHQSAALVTLVGNAVHSGRSHPYPNGRTPYCPLESRSRVALTDTAHENEAALRRRGCGHRRHP